MESAGAGSYPVRMGSISHPDFFWESDKGGLLKRNQR